MSNFATRYKNLNYKYPKQLKMKLKNFSVKSRIDRLVLILFVLAMCFLMSISAKAETGSEYFFTENYSGGKIELKGLTASPTGAVVLQTFQKDIFDRTVNHGIRVSNSSKQNLKINTSIQGILLVYYARAWSNGYSSNDMYDLELSEKTQAVAEYCGAEGNINYGVKFFKLSSGREYIIGTSSTCRVYGFVYMPGNVAAYDVKGQGDLSLIGQYCANYRDVKPSGQYGDVYLEGWYEDAAYTKKVTLNTVLNEPTVIFAKWSRCVWDFAGVSSNNDVIQDYDGMIIKKPLNSGSTDKSYGLSDTGFKIFTPSTVEYRHIAFTPQYNGELTVTYKSTGTSTTNTCQIGLGGIEEKDVVATGTASATEKTISAKLTAGQPYYIYTTTGGICISKLQYIAGAASADVSGDVVTLTTTANMQGWRPFYDDKCSYTADDNTNVYVVVKKDAADITFKNVKQSGKNRVPKGCPVLLHAKEATSDGTYRIELKEDSEEDTFAYVDEDNLLKVSDGTGPVDAFRLGYRSGEDNGVAFYQWSADCPSAGVIYLDYVEMQGSAKLSLDFDDVTTGISSVADSHRMGMFNLNGQRLTAPSRGINIINGKKVIVK